MSLVIYINCVHNFIVLVLFLFESSTSQFLWLLVIKLDKSGFLSTLWNGTLQNFYRKVLFQNFNSRSCTHFVVSKHFSDVINFLFGNRPINIIACSVTGIIFSSYLSLNLPYRLWLCCICLKYSFELLEFEFDTPLSLCCISFLLQHLFSEKSIFQ